MSGLSTVRDARDVEALATTPIEACMTRDPVTVSVTDNCRWVLAVMSAAGIHHLPVLDAGRLVGIVTEADVLRRAPALQRGERRARPSSAILDHTSVAGVMTYAPITVPPTFPLGKATSLMVSHGFGSLPVVDGDAVVGIVTHADVLRHLRDVFATCS